MFPQIPNLRCHDCRFNSKLMKTCHEQVTRREMSMSSKYLPENITCCQNLHLQDEYLLKLIELQKFHPQLSKWKHQMFLLPNQRSKCYFWHLFAYQDHMLKSKNKKIDLMHNLDPTLGVAMGVEGVYPSMWEVKVGGGPR